MNAESPLILVVDDEEDICRNLSDILGDLGCRVETASNGASALEMVKRRPYDVALLDLRMPGMDGLELCRAMKAVRSETVAILVTAHASGSTAEEALASGVWQVVPKPVNLGRLLKLVDEALGLPLVLVVDDDREMGSNLRDLFRERGYRVTLAHDTSEAADRLRKASFRVVLIDMKLPGGSGCDVFRVVREVNPDARIVLITGCRSDSDVLSERILRENVDAVCYKPFDVPRLLSAVQELAGQAREAGRDESGRRRQG